MVGVLFVEREAAQLDSLRSELRSMEGEWEMRFVATPRAAREAINDRMPDVVVIDLALPEVDGVKLLKDVRRFHRDTIRIVTSAQPGHRGYVDSIGVAHQFLQKPFEAGALREAIERARVLRRFAARPEVAAAVRGLGRPPHLPQIVRALTQAVQREASLSEIGTIVGSDARMTARLLQVANSAFFAPRHPIRSAELAASFLGLGMLRAIILFEALCLDEAGGSVVEGRLRTIWRHSMEVAATARRLAEHERLPHEEVASAFSLGILHDIGAILLSRHHDPLDAGVASRAADEVELDRDGLAHTEAGAWLALDWGLPDDVVEVVSFHHDPRRFASGNPPTAGFLVAAACAFRDAATGAPDAVALERLREALALRGLADRFDPWQGLADAVERERHGLTLAEPVATPTPG